MTRTPFRIVLVLLVMGWLMPFTAYAATLSVVPASGTYAVGDTVTARIAVSSDVSVNAVSAGLSFSNDTLSLTSISKSNSFLTFWAQDPTFSNSAGTASFEGVSLGTGYTGSGGTVVTLYFKAKAAGDALVSFKSASVLANDGQGTDVTQGKNGASFTIKAAPQAEKTAPRTDDSNQTPVPPAPESVLVESPTLALGTNMVSGVRQSVIIGISKYPHATTTVYIGADVETSIRIALITDANGAFTTPVPEDLRPGVYIVRATVTPLGQESAPSESLEVPVGSQLARMLEAALPFVLMFLAALALCAGVIFALWYGTFRMVVAQNNIVREAKEAELAVKKSFRLLRGDLAEHLKHLKTQGMVSAADRETLADMKKDFEEAEAYITKEIHDVADAKPKETEPT